ncbi:MAG: hypothetical protein QOI26_2644, partial [Pseudonocardiales bacterium]|nr:hypothetical protein [Pseudonocardiales bacterium]
MTNPTKPASGGPKNQPRKVTAGGTASTGPARTAANRAQSKKIVNQRQTPWGLITATLLIVLLAVGVIGYAVNQNKKKSDASNPAKIAGIVHKTFSGGQHKTGVISYAESPPIGGPHSPIWADCDGTVYPNQIANENAVHDLEHGAVWITYKPGLPNEQLDVLTKLVSNHPYTLLTPYAGLKSNVSLQAWGYQLFVDSATDSRVQRFINTLRQSQTNTPELGASCSNPAKIAGIVHKTFSGGQHKTG